MNWERNILKEPLSMREGSLVTNLSKDDIQTMLNEIPYYREA